MIQTSADATVDSIPSAAAFATAATMLSVLGHEGRLRLLLCLHRHGPEAVHTLTDRLNLSQSNISHQLRILRDARLVISQRQGQQVFYSLTDQHVVQLIQAALEHAAEDHPANTHREST